MGFGEDGWRRATWSLVRKVRVEASSETAMERIAVTHAFCNRGVEGVGGVCRGHVQDHSGGEARRGLRR